MLIFSIFYCKYYILQYKNLFPYFIKIYLSLVAMFYKNIYHLFYLIYLGTFHNFKNN